MSEFRIGHLEVVSPFGNAGGVVKTPEEAEQMSFTGVGWVEGGSYTLERRAGNSPNGEVVYHHDATAGESFNSLGMPNKGMDVVEKQVPEMVSTAHKLGNKFVGNVAPVSEDPVSETQELVERMYIAGADAVLLNAGCPNVVTKDGGRHEILSHNPQAFSAVINGLSDIIQKHGKPIFVRTSPFESYPDAQKVFRSIDDKLVSAIFTPNTWPGHVPRDEAGDEILEVPGGAGGKSGPATAKDAHQQTGWALSASKIGGRNFDIVSSGGIMTGQELKIRMHLGAAAGAGTTLYYESAEEGWSEATDRLLRQYAT
jgi:dihydroorotate dehydrogenase